MGGLNTIGHAISNDKVNLDAGCKSLLGCTPVAAFIAKNCIPEFHDMALDKIQEFIVYKKAKSEMTPEELAEIQKSNIPPVEISRHPVEDLPDKLNEKNVESKSKMREQYTTMCCSILACLAVKPIESLWILKLKISTILDTTC